MTSQDVDKRSGLTFKLGNTFSSTPKAPIRHSPPSNFSLGAKSPPHTPDDYDTTSSYQSYLHTPQSPTTVSTHTQLLDTQLSTENPDEFYKYLPAHLNDTARLKQLIYWAAKEQIKRERPSLNKESMKVKRISGKLKENFLNSLESGEIPLYWFSTQLNTEVNLRPNPKNAKNLEKIKKLQDAIEDLKKEEEEWKKATSHVNMFHALAVNSEENNGKELEFGNNYLKELGEDQLEKVQEALEPVQDMEMNKDMNDIQFRIRDTCQTLDITNEFQSRANHAVDKIHARIANRLETSRRIEKDEWYQLNEKSSKEVDNDIALNLGYCMDYFIMDRASDVAANDLAEIRKLIEGMNALVNSQLQLQAQNEQIPTEKKPVDPPSVDPVVQESQVEAKNIVNKPSLENPAPIQQSPTNTQLYSHDTPELPPTGVITEVTHLTSSRTLFFQLAQDATIDPLIIWLRLSFQDPYISGMVLQYKGLDGLWKCLLNRDDSLRRVIKQTLKNNVMLQMRVPREEDLLSSGYMDRRLLALTKPNI